ncbi:MAG TPA: hypothetical protein VNW46_18140 [Gemmatimonadaceae bacterium]|nr:hypothetical protein [Gemmatimonadaceae bacterium]
MTARIHRGLVARARFALPVLAFAAVSATAGAQDHGHGHGHGHDGGDEGGGAPPGQLPPRGQCRIWFDGLPPGHQPLPSDCETAFRDAPPDARVLVGEGVDAHGYSRGDHDHGNHNGWGKEHGRKRDGDDRDEERGAPPPPPPPADCLVYTPDGQCAGAYMPAGPPPALPDMIGAVFMAEGRVWPEAQRWLGGLQLTAHVDAVVGGRPARVRWTDSNGRLVQEWIDVNGNGRAGVVRVYRRGVLVRTFKS